MLLALRLVFLDLLDAFWLLKCFETLGSGPRITLLRFLVLLSFFIEIRVLLFQPSPLNSPLEKAEVAPRPGTPFVVGRQAHRGIFENSKNVVLADPVFLERVARLDVGFG